MANHDVKRLFSKHIDAIPNQLLCRPPNTTLDQHLESLYGYSFAVKMILQRLDNLPDNTQTRRKGIT